MNNWQNFITEFAKIDIGDPKNILKWAWDRFKSNIIATSSFQSQSVPLLHMISKCAPELRVVFLDTGFHFSETLAFRDQLVERFGLNLQVIKPEIEKDTFTSQHVELFRTNPDLCCYINKVAPMKKELVGVNAWISGIRRVQTDQRANMPIISKRKDGVIKIAPLAGWTDKDVWKYMHEYDLPVHPLMSNGYMSIGCAPCTRPVFPGEDEREGRWSGQDKTECGLHLPISGEAIEE